MADLAFSQPERRSFLVPAVVAVLVLAAIFGIVFALTPHRIADISVTHTALLPTHTVFKSGSNLVGAQDAASDVLYVLVTIHIDDKLNLPLFLKDITATLDTPQGSLDTSAAQKNDLPNLYITFPALKPLATAPLLRETAIQPGQSAEGMVLLNFPITQELWDKRTAATVTLDFYHQGPITVTIPKP